MVWGSALDIIAFFSRVGAGAPKKRPGAKFADTFHETSKNRFLEGSKKFEKIIYSSSTPPLPPIIANLGRRGESLTPIIRKSGDKPRQTKFELGVPWGFLPHFGRGLGEEEDLGEIIGDKGREKFACTWVNLHLNVIWMTFNALL